MTARSPILPVLCACLGGALGGVAGALTRYLADEIDPLSLATIRYGGAGLLLLALAAALGARPLAIARRDLPVIALFGLSQFAVFGVLFTAAFGYVPAARGALVLATMPLSTLLLSGLAGRERVDATRIVGVVLGFAGVAVALGDRAVALHPEAWKGDAMLFAASFLGSLSNVIAGPYLRRYSALAVTGVAGSIAAVVMVAWMAAFAPPLDVAALGARTLWTIAFLTVIAGALCFYAWIWALEHIAPTRVAITVTLNPVAAALLGLWLLDEPVGLRLLVGLALVALGIAIVNQRAPASVAADARR